MGWLSWSSWQTGQQGQRGQARQTGQTSEEDWQDRQIWHLNLTFRVTCVGQLSQFLRCLGLLIYWPQMFKSNRVSLNWATDIDTYIELSPLGHWGYSLACFSFFKTENIGFCEGRRKTASIVDCSFRETTQACFLIHICVRFPKTGKIVKMWHFSVFFGALLWPKCLIFLSFLICSEEILPVAF